MQLDFHIRKTLQSGARVFTLDVRLQAQAQRVVIAGPSGAGKSQALKGIAGLLRPDAGHVRIDGQTLYDSERGIFMPPQARRLAYVFQDYALFAHLNVRQNIAFALSRGWLNPRRGARHAAVEYWIEAFELGPLAHQYPHELSGGQRQRTALARALVAQPRALLLDEPFAALDSELRQTMRAELDALQRRLQVPMVLITHDPQDVALFGEQVLHLHEGRVQAAPTRSTPDLNPQADDSYTARVAPATLAR